MKFQKEKLKKLLILAVEKTGKSLTHYDILEMNAEINAQIEEGTLNGSRIGARYIYNSIFMLLDKEGDIISLNKSYVDIIARYAGFKDYDDFRRSLHPEKNVTEHELLKRCGGVWKSYARTNSGRRQLLVAPLHIFQEGAKMKIQMRGNRNTLYESELTSMGACLRCTLGGKEKDTKQIYMVMRLGIEEKPKVLMGIFAGMSTGGEPIGGREVWVREEDGVTFDSLNHQRINMDNEEAKDLHPNILHYFDSKEKNCWKATSPSTFDIEDLMNG